MSEEVKRENFKIPPPYRAWCHLCSDGGKGFISIEELQKHHIKVHVSKARAGVTVAA